jgi:hypothetical protein
VERRQLEGTFEAAWAHLGIETQRQWTDISWMPYEDADMVTIPKSLLACLPDVLAYAA